MRRLRLFFSGFLITLFTISLISSSILAYATTDISVLYQTANKHLQKGELRQAIDVYDEILVIAPENTNVMLMKGIALSNLDRHKQSMKEFYNVLEKEPNNVVAMVGLGVGFGNFGEYKAAAAYFDSAYDIKPNDQIVKNHKEFADKVVNKYPYNEVEKPEYFEIKLVENVPAWVKNTAEWWASNQIDDSEFLASIQFLIKNNIITIDSVKEQNYEGSGIPAWVKNTAEWWASNQIDDSEFLASIQFLIKNGFIMIELSKMHEMTEEEQKISDRNRWQFARYLDKIEKTVNEDRRYIEYPNPSNDVIKKFMRDYAQWNFEQQIQIGNKSFPDPKYVLVDGIYHLEYKVYVNKQPHGLPLDHVSTLVDSFKYWEERELVANDGKTVKIHFVTTKSKTDANLWVTWVVRDIGENVLGHANLGKGVIEVALGGYACGGSFQLFAVETVEIIMTHELGHGIGLKHTSDKESIMYPAIKETKYAYCMLDISN